MTYNFCWNYLIDNQKVINHVSKLKVSLSKVEYLRGIAVILLLLITRNTDQIRKANF